MADDVASQMQMVVLEGPPRSGQLALGPVAGPGASEAAPNALMQPSMSENTGAHSSAAGGDTQRSRPDFNVNNVVMWLKQRTGHHSQTPRARERARALERQRLVAASGAGFGGISALEEKHSLLGLDLTVRATGRLQVFGGANGSSDAGSVAIGSSGSVLSSRSSQTQANALQLLREHKRNDTIDEEYVRPTKRAPEPTPAVHETLQRQRRIAIHEKRSVSLVRILTHIIVYSHLLHVYAL